MPTLPKPFWVSEWAFGSAAVSHQCLQVSLRRLWCWYWGLFFFNPVVQLDFSLYISFIYSLCTFSLSYIFPRVSSVQKVSSHEKQKTNIRKDFKNIYIPFGESMWGNKNCFLEELELRGGNQPVCGKCKHPLQKSVKSIANSEMCMHTKYCWMQEFSFPSFWHVKHYYSHYLDKPSWSSLPFPLIMPFLSFSSPWSFHHSVFPLSLLL